MPSSTKTKKKLTTSLLIRLTPEEKQLLQEKSDRAGVSMADLLRQSIEEIKVYRTDKTKMAKMNETLIQIRRIGINVNQLARWVNTYKGTADSLEVISELRSIKALLNKLAAGGGDAD